MIEHISENEFENITNENCIIDFYATWCMPCKMLAPVFETVSENYEDKLKFYKVNIDENPKLTEKLSIMHVPTLVILKNGEVVNRVSGFMDERELANFIDKSL